MEVLLQACSLLLDCAFNEKDEQIFTNHKRKWFEKENVFEKNVIWYVVDSMNGTNGNDYQLNHHKRRQLNEWLALLYGRFLLRQPCQQFSFSHTSTPVHTYLYRRL